MKLHNASLRSIFSACLLLAGWSLAAQAAPDAFSFIERSEVPLSSFVTSESKTMSGITEPLAVSVSGGNSPQYSINSAAFTASPGSIANGQTLTVRHISAAVAGTATTTTVNVGPSFSTVFKSVTSNADRVPDGFGFGGQGNVAPGALIESASIILTGFNSGATVLAGPGAEYRIDGGSYTSASGILQPGQSLTLRHTAGTKRLEYTKTYLRVGGVVGYFTTRTQGALSQAAYPLPASGLSVAATSVSEGSAATPGSMVFRVILGKASSAPVMVDYATADDQALAGKDYTAKTGTLTFAAGETSKTVSVSLIGDDCNEADKAFKLVLSNARGATLDVAQAAGTILNDDPLGSPFKVGSAQRVVSPRAVDIAGWPHEYCATLTRKVQYSYLGGFGLRDLGADPCDTSPANVAGKAPITGVGKDWKLRIMIVQQSATNRMAFVTLDAIGAGNIIYKGVKRAVNQATGIPEDNVLFGQTHSHSGADLQGIWGGMPYEWKHYLYDQAKAAATEAQANLADADLRYTQAIVDMPSYSNYRREDPTIGTDKRMTIIQARRQSDGVVLGTLVQHVAHPTVIGSNNRLTHPDWIYGLTAKLEETYGSTAIFYNGPIADASPNPSAAGNTAGLDAYARAEFMGRGLAGKVITLIDGGMQKFMPLMNVQHASASLAITNDLFIAVAAKGWFNGYYDFANATPDPDARATPAPQPVSTAVTKVSRVTLGKIGCECLEVVTIPGEASNIIGKFVRSLAPRDMALLGLTQNSFGYILDESQFATENGTTLVTAPDPVYPLGYEEGVSLGVGTAEALRVQAWNPLFGLPANNGAPGPKP